MFRIFGWVGRWWRRFNKRCPWCNEKLLFTFGKQRTGPLRTREWTGCACPNAHYGEEFDDAGLKLIYQDKGNQLPFLVEAFGLKQLAAMRVPHVPGTPRGIVSGRPRHRKME